MVAQSKGTSTGNPFAVDAESDVPVGTQLAWRLRALIVTGRLPSGEAVPSVRRMAEWAGVNVNTVRSVYESLEREGLIFSHQGRGTFVADSAVPEPDLESIALDALRRGQESGRDPRDVAIVVMACANMLASDEQIGSPPEPVVLEPGEESETIEIRQELRRQIARLEAELSAYVRDLAPNELPTAPTRAKAHVADVEELEQTRDTLIAKLSKARQAAERRAKREGEARAQTETTGAGPLARAASWWSAPSRARSGRSRARG